MTLSKSLKSLSSGTSALKCDTKNIFPSSFPVINYEPQMSTNESSFELGQAMQEFIPRSLGTEYFQNSRSHLGKERVKRAWTKWLISTRALSTNYFT